MCISIIHDLRRAQGRNKKMQVLARENNNKIWKRYLQYVYDESINYYVSAPVDSTFKDTVDMEDLFEFLDDLIEHNDTGNKLRRKVVQASKVYGELFRLVLDRSIKSGISSATINKMYGNIIPTFEVMLAKDAPIERFPVYASTKYDGVRVVAEVKGYNAILRTRSGKRLKIQSLEDAFTDCGDGVYDGELVDAQGHQIGRTKITGQVNKVLKGSSTDLDNYTMFVFDHLHLPEWSKQQCNRAYRTRLESLVSNLRSTTNLKIAPQRLLHSHQEANDMFDGRIALGYEGIMCRYPQDPYLWKRSDTLIKKKATYSAILTCDGIQGGTGKYEGMIGSLICTGKVNSQYVKVKVGSGLSDYDRDLDPRYYVGKKIEVMYNDIITSDGVVYSLFLPRFKRIRHDKDT